MALSSKEKRFDQVEIQDTFRNAVKLLTGFVTEPQDLQLIQKYGIRDIV